jgi:class 3 adenylate cyclase/tetratricopeptide (TPR) repeat protein
MRKIRFGRFTEDAVDIATWLNGLGLSKYETVFRDNAIDLELLPRLTGEDIRDLGITAVGDRRRLIDAIAALAAKPAAASATRPPPAEAGERRQATVLFADLAGFTRLSTEIDTEKLHEIRRLYISEASRVVADHGGTVERHIGDSVMGVFGAPVAHDNDPERAVRAALAIHDLMPALSARTRIELGVHIGVASGEVVATSGGSEGESFSVTGESVNLASRLTNEAKRGETIVSGPVRRALAGRFELADVGVLPVKGFNEPITAFRVVGLAEVRNDERALVGRRLEMRQLASALASCRETGAGQSVLVRGDAGIGKSRLVLEFLRRARSEGFACHSALVLDFGAGTGRDAVRSLARSLARDHTAAADAIETAQRPFLRELIGADLTPVEREVLAAMDHATRTRGLRSAVSSLTIAASRERPLLLVVEDLHWADAGVLDAVSVLAEAASENPVLLALTTRIDGDPTMKGWRPPGALLTIDLAPLRMEDAVVLAASFKGAAERYVAECLERAAGNPLFLEQLLRHAEERAATAVPDSVQSLVQARIDRLASSDREALQAAAVLGQRFSIEAVEHLLDRPHDPTHIVAHHLARLQDGDYLFAHALVRDGVYATLLHNRRRELHLRAAAWFEERDKALWAEHLERAGDEQAPRAFLLAARGEASQNRLESALALVEQGLCSSAMPDARFELACLRGDVLHRMDRNPEARAAFEEALGIAADDAQRCRAWIGLASTKRITDDLAGAMADLDLAGEAAGRLGLAEEAARIHFLRGNLLFPQGDLPGVRREHSLSLERAIEAGSAELEACALGGLGDAAYMDGRLLSARERFSRCVQVSEERGFRRIAVANRPMAAMTRLFTGDAKGSLREAEEAVRAAQEVGHRRAEAISHHAVFFAALSLMQLDLAGRSVERALDLARQLGAPRFEAEALALGSVLKFLDGDAASAREDIAEAFRLLQTLGLPYLGPMFYGLLGRFGASEADRKDALAKGEVMLQTNRVAHNHLFLRMCGIDSCLDDEDWDGAVHHADELETYAADEPSRWTRFIAARGRALAGWGRGRRDAALVAEIAMLADEAQECGFVAERQALAEVLDVYAGGAGSLGREMRA